MPTDCLFVRYLQPTLVQGGGSTPIFPFPSSIAPSVYPRQQVDFVIATDYVNGNLTKVILTNLSMAQIIYTQNNPNPDFWDSEFQAGMVASLAAFLIPPLNLNMGLMNIQIRLADQIIEKARATDGNEGVVSQNREASWIVARGAGSWIGGNYQYQEYGQMSWPQV